MIKIQRKEECCGCKACGDVCRHGAISFHTDAEGIWYPKVNLEACVECGLCEKVCPVLHPDFSYLENSENPETYVLQAPNLEDRLASASGAAYSLIARAVFEQGGYVAGHIWKDKTNVVGYVSANPKDLDILRGTKYLQSDTEGIFKTVSSLLKENKLVLFSGCPCQVAAMRKFLRKEYDNLITTDFTCMGIDSPLAFAKYIESLERQYGAEMIYFKAKAKDVGWTHLTNKAIFSNGKTYFGINGEDANLKATFLDVLVRPSCYECKFKGFPRTADITIGDYWRRKYDYDPLDDNTGTSYVILNNEKAERFFERCKPHCHYRQTIHTEILGANPLAVRSLPRPTFSRDEFYERIQHEDFKAVVDDYYSRMHRSTKRDYKHGIKYLIKSAIYYRHYPLSFLRFIYYNFFSRKIKSDFWKGDVLHVRNAKLHLSKGCNMNVKGQCIIDAVNKNSTHITVESGSAIHLNENVIKGSTQIHVGNKAALKLGKFTEVADNANITLHLDCNIDAFSLISDNVTIDDTNEGVVLFNETTKPGQSINIGTHVLIRRGSVVTKGTTLCDETIVTENSVVSGNHESRIVLSGNPAKKIENNINWKYNLKTKWNFKN